MSETRQQEIDASKVNVVRILHFDESKLKSKGSPWQVVPESFSSESDAANWLAKNGTAGEIYSIVNVVKCGELRIRPAVYFENSVLDAPF